MTAEAQDDELEARRSGIAKAKEAFIKAAREDAVAFLSYVMRDARTGARWKLAPMHTAWQDMLDRHPQVVLWSHIEGGKSSAISVGRTLFELGRDMVENGGKPTLRVVVLGNTIGAARKITSQIARYIEGSVPGGSDALHEVFPELRRGDIWTQTELRVAGATFGKDPSVQAVGVHGQIVGSRIDLLIIDDILDWENSRTEDEREKLWDWLQSSVIGRLTQGARMWVVGNAYHPKDVLHRLAESGVHAVRYPVIDDEGKPRWPEVWSLERIKEKQDILTPYEFARQLLCIVRDDAERRCKYEWVQKCLERGKGRQLVPRLDSMPPGCKMFTGVDLAVQQHSAADKTALFTVLIHPNEDRELLWIECGRWTGPEIVTRIVDQHRRYHSFVIVENNAAQEYILQFAREFTAVPILPFTTGRNKAHPEFGIESMFVELSNGKWIIPNQGEKSIHPEVQSWINEMLDYDPNLHTGDRLMASWFAREGSRMPTVAQKVQFGRVDWTRR